MKYWLTISIMLLITAANASEPAKMTANQQIKNAALAFLKLKVASLGLKDTEIHVNDIDNRLKLAVCQQKLLITNNQNSRLPGSTSLLISCKQVNRPWKIYIQANVHAFERIIVAKSPIMRGERITANHIRHQRTNITNLNGNYLTENRQIIGMTTRQTIQLGQAIKPFILLKSRLIRRGEQVTILAETGGISVRMRGKALNDATNGGFVRVLNTRSKRIVEGIAIRPGIVQIKM